MPNEVSKEEALKKRIQFYLDEIQHFLDTKDLDPALAGCLEFCKEDLTKEGATVDELNGYCAVYENCYRLPCQLSSDLKKSTNVKK